MPSFLLPALAVDVLLNRYTSIVVGTVTRFREHQEMSFVQSGRKQQGRLRVERVQYSSTSWFTVNGQKTLIGKTSRRFNELDPETLQKCAMGHYESFGARDFSFLEYVTAFRGSNGIQVVLRRSLHFGTPENRHYDTFFHFFKNELSTHNLRKDPTNFHGKTRSTGA